jgi:hypothetical protein
MDTTKNSSKGENLVSEGEGAAIKFSYKLTFKPFTAVFTDSACLFWMTEL